MSILELTNPKPITSGTYQGVVELRGRESFGLWKKSIERHLRSKGRAAPCLFGSWEEPFRQKDRPKPKGQHAGDVPPTGLDVDLDNTSDPLANVIRVSERTRLTRDQEKSWNEWALAENAARAAVLSTVSPAICGRLEDMWSSHDMLKWLKNIYKPKIDEDYHLLEARFRGLYMPDNPTIEDMRLYLDEFTIILNDATEMNVSYEDHAKKSLFKHGLSDDLHEMMYFEETHGRRADPNGPLTWDEFLNAYNEIVNAVVSRKTHQAISLSHTPTTAKSNKPNSYRGRTPLAEVRSIQGRNNMGSSHRNDRRSDDTHHKKHDHGNGHGHGQNHGDAVATCDHCGRKGHTKPICDQYLAGEPSKKEKNKQLMDEFIQWRRNRNKNQKGPKPVDSVAHVTRHEETVGEEGQLIDDSLDDDLQQTLNLVLQDEQLDVNALHQVVDDPYANISDFEDDDLVEQPVFYLNRANPRQ